MREAGFSVAGLHLAGHGLCRRKSGFTFESLLAQGLEAEKWLHRNGYAHVVVCGHSQGGILTLAHAGASSTIGAAFAISAIFPRMASAIELTRFARLAHMREWLMNIIRSLAAKMPRLPIPMPVYLNAGRILRGRELPVYLGTGKGRISYPLQFLASLFDAFVSPVLHCPFWLFNAINDDLFTEKLIKETFALIQAPVKKLVWLDNGGHLAPLTPRFANFIARYAAAATAGLAMPINLTLRHCHAA